MLDVIQSILLNVNYHGQFDKVRVPQIQMAWKNKLCHVGPRSCTAALCWLKKYHGKFDEARMQQMQTAWKNKQFHAERLVE
jgi:hypothetical protein